VSLRRPYTAGALSLALITDGDHLLMINAIAGAVMALLGGYVYDLVPTKKGIGIIMTTLNLTQLASFIFLLVIQTTESVRDARMPHAWPYAHALPPSRSYSQPSPGTRRTRATPYRPLSHPALSPQVSLPALQVFMVVSGFSAVIPVALPFQMYAISNGGSRHVGLLIAAFELSAQFFYALLGLGTSARRALIPHTERAACPLAIHSQTMLIPCSQPLLATFLAMCTLCSVPCLAQC
jgi:hypothetical protein